MTIYRWNGPEKSLGGIPVTAVHMAVESFDEIDGKSFAKGVFIFHDHVEGCESGKIPWEARGDGKEWVVKSVEDTIFHSRETGESLFCAADSVNTDIKKFISEKLTWIAEYKKKNPGELLDLVDEPARFKGEMYTYVGECVCELLRRSTKGNPFPWLKYTNNGQFPNQCFLCSCGEKWYLGNPSRELWCRVGDPKAWAMLTQFNGVAVEPIDVHPSRNPPVIVLLSTLRNEGYIPL